MSNNSTTHNIDKVGIKENWMDSIINSSIETINNIIASVGAWSNLQRRFELLVRKFDKLKQIVQSSDVENFKLLEDVEECIHRCSNLRYWNTFDVASIVSEIDQWIEKLDVELSKGEDTRTAEQGHPQKQFQKAMNCVSGIIVLAPDGSVSDPPADDIKDALHWFDMARLNGHRLATFYYATFLHRGIATQMDRAKAARIVYDILGSLKKEAEKKMTEAEFILGYCYLWGMCVKPNKMKAFDLFTNASARGDKNAQFYAGLFDFDELLSEQPKNWTTRFSKRKVSSVGEDHRSAFERLTQSNFALGELALSEIENNHDFALRGLSKVDATDPVAICLAGVCYYHGIGVPADKDKAIQFWKRSAKYGYWRAQWGLLKYQECVAGEVIISQEEAKKWQSEYSKMGKNFRRLHLVGVQ